MNTARNESTDAVARTGGFTLMELLVVIGIIGILAAIVIVAINPSRQFAQARNTQRESNVSTILNAIGQNIADNKGIFTCSTDNLPTGDATWGDDEQNIGEASGNVDLSCLLGVYIPADQLPYDPTIATVAAGTDDTEYTVEVNDVGRIQICAPLHGDEDALPDVDEYCLTR